MSSDLVARYMERWRSKLIDLTRRNPLISLRGGRKSCLPVSRPAGQAVFDALVREGLPLSFWMPPVDEEGPVPRRKRSRSALDLDRYDPHAGQLLCGDLGRRELHAAMTNLYRRSHADFQDRGLHTLHVVFGLVEWQEKGKPGTLRSPLLLLPVRLSRPSLSSPFTLHNVDEPPILNPALEARFQRDDVGVRLPRPPLDWDGIAIADYFGAVESLLPGWKLDRSTLLTLLSFHKGVMYQDLVENADCASRHFLVRSLAGVEGIPAAAPLPDERSLDALPVAQEPCHILDADASQRLCLEAARRGHSFVLLGPPGTGKSQTITNLIADAIADGKSVLFVSEKVAALEVVSSRLQRAGLGELCLPLHTSNVSKQAIIEELWRCCAQRGQVEPPAQPEDHARLRLRRDQLNAWVRALHQPRGPLGRSVWEAFGEVAKREGVVRVPLGLNDPLEITPDWLEAAEGLGRRTQQLWHVLLEGDALPWRGFRADCFTLPLRDEVSELIERARTAVRQLRSAMASYAERLGLKDIPDATWLMQIAELLQCSPAPPAAWLTTANFSDLQQESQQLATTAEEQQRRRDALAARYGPALRTLPDRTADALQTVWLQVQQWVDPALGTVLAQRHALLGWARQTRQSVDSWRSTASLLARWFGIPLDNPTVEALRGLLHLLELSQQGAQPDRTWFDPVALRRAREAILLGRDACTEYRRRRDWLLTRYDERFFDLDLDRLAERFSGPYRGWLRTLYPGYHAARRAIARVSRDGTVPASVREDVLSARQVRALHHRLTADQPLYSAALGHFYQGIHSDLDAAARAVAIVEEALTTAQQLGWHPFPSPLAEVFAHAARPPADIACAAQEAAESLTAWEQMTNAIRDIVRGGDRLDRASLTDLQQHAADIEGPLEAFVAIIDPLLATASEPITEVEVLLDDLREAEELRACEPGPDWTAQLAALQWSRRLRELFSGSVPRSVVRIACAGPSAAPPIERIRASQEELGAALLALEQRFDPPGLRLNELSQAALEARLDTLAERIGELQDWIDWCALAPRYRELGLGAFWEALCRARPPADQVTDVLLLAVHLAWAEAVCKSDPELRDFRRAEHEERIAEFRELDRQVLRANALRVRQRVRQHQLPEAEAATLGREASKRTRQLPLRRLFAEIPNLLLRLKPCLFMSPLTVSQYLDPERLQSDLVVFDEASQICPEDAIGAIFRSRQVIVAGDSKQLPPTAFFQNIEDENDDPNGDHLADFTSILDACQGAGLPVRMLRWHYRSRHESLIAYSNRHFYDNRLVTFPAARAACPALGVSFVHVTDGVYDRGGCCDNPREAAVVANLVVHHFREQPERTLGVIAFSHAQMNAIADEVERRAREAPELEKFLSQGAAGPAGSGQRGDRLEGFFVKNLETVQGDERDVIVFSVGYGRDAQGRLSMNFGPLNQDDGERRLNVAITRAREKVVVVSSLEARDLHVTAATPAGVQHLRRYLAFAAGADLGTDRGSAAGAKPLSPLETDVCRVVEAFGYPVVSGVGWSEFRIDLGVMDPARPGTFLLGIECDGGAYRAAATARDRDRLRPEVLAGLGWRIHRIWSPEWFRNRGDEIARLREALEAARLQWTLPRRSRPSPSGLGERLAVLTRRNGENGHVFPGSVPYRVCDLGVREEFQGGEFTDRAARQEQSRLLARLVSVEGPIHVEVATERLRKAWRLGRTGERMRQAVEEAIAFCEARHQLQRRGDFLWSADGREPAVRAPDAAIPESYRDVLHIAPEELQAGLRLLVREGLGEEEELLSQAARLFGFGRLGDHIRRRLSQELEAIKRLGRGRVVNVV